MERITFTLPRDLRAAADQAAADMDMDFSQFTRYCLLREMGRDAKVAEAEARKSRSARRLAEKVERYPDHKSSTTVIVEDGVRLSSKTAEGSRVLKRAMEKVAAKKQTP